MLTERLAKSFSTNIRQRGARYFRDGRIKALKIDADSITARVAGSEWYEVRITLARSPAKWTLDSACDCPFTGQYGGPCKHVWATLLAAEHENRAFFEDSPSKVVLRASEGLDNDDVENDDQDERAEHEEKTGNKPLRLTWGETKPRGRAKRRAATASPDPLAYLEELAQRLGGSLVSDKRGDVGVFLSSDRSKQRAERLPAWRRAIRLAAPPTVYRERHEKPRVIGEPLYVVDAERSRESGVLTLALMHRPLSTKPGRMLKPKRLALGVSDVSRLADHTDRLICGMLIGAGEPASTYGYGYSGSAHANGSRSALWAVDVSMLAVLMPLLKETGRLMYQYSEGAAPLPMIVEDATAENTWELVLRIVEPASSASASRNGSRKQSKTAANSRTGLALIATVQRGGEWSELSHTDVLIDGEPGLLVRGRTISPLRTGGDAQIEFARRLGVHKPAGLSESDLPELINELNTQGVRLPIAWPETWRTPPMADAVPRGRLTLHSTPPERVRFLPAGMTAADVSFDYGGASVDASDGRRYMSVDSSFVRRDAAAERALVERLAGLDITPDSTYSSGKDIFRVPTKRIPAIVPALLSEGWTVLGDKAFYRTPGAFRINVSSGIDWFSLEGHVEFGEQRADIAQLLHAMKHAQRFVTLGDGSLGVLPEEWLDKHARWLRMGRADENGGVRFATTQLSLVDVLLAEMPEATCDAQVTAARARLAAFDGVRPVPEPASFNGMLRGYQRAGLGWLSFLDDFGFGGVLADDMGLGKTVQLLAHIAGQREKGNAKTREPWLIVAPKSLVFNWSREAARFTPHLKVVEHAGAQRKHLAKALPAADIVLTTYGTLRTDVELLRQIAWAGVVLDEAQTIKNAASQSAKAARLVGASAKRRLALSGTPVENSLDDLWSIMEFLNPGMLGTSRVFRELSRGASASADLPHIRRAVRPFILRRTKQLVAPELPERIEQTVECDMEPAQRTLYTGLLAHYREKLLGKDGRLERQGFNKSKIHVLEALLRLRQAACHPALIEVKPSAASFRSKTSSTRGMKNAEAGNSAKLDTLLEMLDEILAEGHRALVFSQFTSLLAIVRERLQSRGVSHEYLDGKTPAAERAAAVDRFQSGASDAPRVFVISLKAGGVGLNLTAADYVFLLDPWWNPAVEAQAIDRSHRIGQHKKVIAYRLITRDTVEQRVQELQASKRELAAAIMGEADEAGSTSGGRQIGSADPLASLTREDLDWLLR